ncbi:MAG TPA: hypothetical protein VN088_08435 [Nocardioides sp.]|nr:hypothetical protein [Nocardioides sp.]
MIAFVRQRFRRRRTDSLSEPIEGTRVGYSQLLGDLAGYVGSLHPVLTATDDTRATNLLDSALWLMPTWRGLSQLHDAFLWWSEANGLQPEIAGLLKQAAEHLVLGVESILGQRAPRVVDESRFLMEVEFLLRDFSLDPARIDEWAALPPRKRHQKFGFGQARSRVEKAAGIPHGRVLPDRDEYSLHSRVVHPWPRGELPVPDGTPHDRRSWLATDLGDLLGHGWKVLMAFLGDIEKFLPDEGQEIAGDPPDISAAREVLDDYAEQMRALRVPVRPDHVDIQGWARDAPDSMPADGDGADS